MSAIATVRSTAYDKFRSAYTCSWDARDISAHLPCGEVGLSSPVACSAEVRQKLTIVWASFSIWNGQQSYNITRKPRLGISYGAVFLVIPMLG